jgi:hypothetical protein
VLLAPVVERFAAQHGHRAAQPPSCSGRRNDVVDETAARRDARVGEISQYSSVNASIAAWSPRSPRKMIDGTPSQASALTGKGEGLAASIHPRRDSEVALEWLFVPHCCRSQLAALGFSFRFILGLKVTLSARV